MNNKNSRNDSGYYQEWVFNTNDLVCSILQYVSDFDSKCIWSHDYSGDLRNRSLVCSHWLYYVFNLKSIYFFNLTDLIKTTQKLLPNMVGNGKGISNSNSKWIDNNINII